MILAGYVDRTACAKAASAQADFELIIQDLEQPAVQTDTVLKYQHDKCTATQKPRQRTQLLLVPEDPSQNGLRRRDNRTMRLLDSNASSCVSRRHLFSGPPTISLKELLGVSHCRSQDVVILAETTPTLGSSYAHTTAYVEFDGILEKQTLLDVDSFIALDEAQLAEGVLPSQGVRQLLLLSPLAPEEYRYKKKQWSLEVCATRELRFTFTVEALPSMLICSSRMHTCISDQNPSYPTTCMPTHLNNQGMHPWVCIRVEPLPSKACSLRTTRS